jgi:hypothetical protein
MAFEMVDEAGSVMHAIKLYDLRDRLPVIIIQGVVSQHDLADFIDEFVGGIFVEFVLHNRVIEPCLRAICQGQVCKK